MKQSVPAQSERRLKIGVVGAGVFGGYHANKCAEHERTEFIGIFDPDYKACKLGAAKHGVQAFKSYETMLEQTEAVIIACPASYHAQMGLSALRAGRHVLVEKPVAAVLTDAQSMVDIAGLNNCVLQVGHQERFVARAIGLDKAPERPIKIIARRMGPFSPRCTDVSVTQDLMTHDIDMVLSLMTAAPINIEGESIIVRSGQPDAARAILSFEGGARAYLEASRVEQGRDRVMEITYPSGSLKVDFVNKTFQNSTPFAFNPDFSGDPSAADSLGAGTDSFIASILDGAPIMVTGRDGLEALRVALAVDA